LDRVYALLLYLLDALTAGEFLCVREGESLCLHVLRLAVFNLLEYLNLDEIHKLEVLADALEKSV